MSLIPFFIQIHFFLHFLFQNHTSYFLPDISDLIFYSHLCMECKYTYGKLFKSLDFSFHIFHIVFTKSNSVTRNVLWHRCFFLRSIFPLFKRTYFTHNFIFPSLTDSYLSPRFPNIFYKVFITGRVFHLLDNPTKNYQIIQQNIYQIIRPKNYQIIQQKKLSDDLMICINVNCTLRT